MATTMHSLTTRLNNFTSSMRSRHQKSRRPSIGAPTLLSTTNPQLITDSPEGGVQLRSDPLDEVYREFQPDAGERVYHTYPIRGNNNNERRYEERDHERVLGGRRPDTPQSSEEEEREAPRPPPKDTRHQDQDFDSEDEEDVRWTPAKPPRIPSLLPTSPIKLSSYTSLASPSHNTSQSLDTDMFPHNRITSPAGERRRTYQTPQQTYNSPPNSSPYDYNNGESSKTQQRRLQLQTPANTIRMDMGQLTPPTSPEDDLRNRIEGTPGTVGYTILGAFNNVTKETIALEPGFEKAWKTYNPNGRRSNTAPQIQPPSNGASKGRHIPLEQYTDQRRSSNQDANAPAYGIFVPTSPANQSMFPYTPSPRDKNILPPPTFPAGRRNSPPHTRTPSPRMMTGPNPLSPTSPTSPTDNRASYKPYSRSHTPSNIPIPAGPRPIPQSNSPAHTSSRLPHFILESPPPPIREPHPSESAERLERYSTPGPERNSSGYQSQQYSNQQSYQHQQQYAHQQQTPTPAPRVRNTNPNYPPPAPKAAPKAIQKPTPTTKRPPTPIKPIITPIAGSKTAYIETRGEDSHVYYSPPLGEILTLDPTRGLGTDGIAGTTSRNDPAKVAPYVEKLYQEHLRKTGKVEEKEHKAKPTMERLYSEIFSSLGPSGDSPPRPTSKLLEPPTSPPPAEGEPAQKEDLISKLEYELEKLETDRAKLRNEIFHLKKVIPFTTTPENRESRMQQMKELEEMEMEEADLGVKIHQIGCRIHRAIRRREKQGGGGFWIQRCQD
ncbi:hypothetical protein BJ508DRAFT_315856 [Ascobolus immersus RN42]|uniref:Uncharacterized protein n=1 Tax=Ascobolus immersus RN42 TaxID=1160509 RepID=A0A3N4H8V7_ASCIM|nr:hypothetical protein BJ508DRAFT_315856 [Ascobolus immersus RN42]